MWGKEEEPNVSLMGVPQEFLEVETKENGFWKTDLMLTRALFE